MNRIIVAISGVILAAIGLYGLRASLDPIYWSLLVWGHDETCSRHPRGGSE